MGVPKFYRWISERYPCLSQVVREFQIPDFDNLYLDMNGIIHTCSHPNDDDPHFRISEEKIFSNICHYVEFLFKMIKPKGVFFMAVDGVAPRAKMNQQRGRRFRTAKTALTLEEQAKTLGQELPAEARFDSNCITPGTEFMARLHACLKGFVAFKVSTDELWKGIRVYLSGHDAPGEGEHKIMEFIRYEKSQPGYNPNTRHCLYGLDADLIMLGLCSHEPYFSLLREEVKFGKKSQKRLMTPEETTFHLLHISLLRDYLEHEFSPVRDRITFDFDVESIIDDFVLMSFLVGNDFIPHLPQLHIHHDALPILFRTYIEVLPSLQGYINEQGILNLGRFEKFLERLAEYDFRRFEELNDDFQYSDSKYKNENHSSACLADLGFSSLAVSKMAEFDSSDSDNDDFDAMQLEFHMHKTDYYVNKLEFDDVSEEVLKEQAEGYVRAIQWNLHYYYNGVVSWSWYYPHHYSPYISDIKNFKDMEMKFELGEPFLPFQQLLAVLPKLSKSLLPLSYQELMCNEDSPLADYYPDDFSTDLNGKQQEWEAIVLIPFINEKLLLKFSALADEKLTAEEKLRNRHGPHLLYTYSPKSCGPLPSFLPGCYPDLSSSYYKCELINQNFFRLPSSSIKKGLCEGVALDKVVLGFPTLKTIEHSAELKNEKVKVFQMISQKENMMLTIKAPEPKKLESLADEIAGKTIYVGWPHLQEALVVELSDGNHRIVKGMLEEMTANDKDIWKKQTGGLKDLNYERWGIFLGPVQVLVQVKTLIGTKVGFSKDGRQVEEKQWSRRVSNFALQSTVWGVNALHLSPNTPECFPPDCLVFVLVPPYFGEMGTVLKADLPKRSVLVKVSVAAEPDLQSIIANQDKYTTEEYKPGYIASQQLGIDSYYLSRLTGTFLIQTSPKGSSNPNRVNVGLNLKFSRKNQEVRGFTKKVDNTWFYSEKAIRLLDTCLKQFPNFFEKLLRFVDEDIVYLEDLYPNGEGLQVINKVTEWLKSQATNSTERQTCGLDKLDAGVIAEIEKKVAQSSCKEEKRSFTKHFQPHQLCNPYLCKGIASAHSNNLKLFDRVVNINHASSVPVGLRGTVTGIGPEIEESERMYEIVFDKAFFGGLSLSCSPGKGYRLPGYSLLNLSSQAKQVKSRANQNPQLTIFDSAIQKLRDNQNAKPFYSVGDMFQSQSLNKVPMRESPGKQFVTPKADYLSPPLKRDYQQNLWAALKSGPRTSSNYGQKLSVEELFSSALPQEVPHSSRSFVEVLCQKCLSQFNAPPTYSYHNYGQTNYHIASVSLPNGMRFASAPCQSKQEAALNAAEKAITTLQVVPVPLNIGNPPVPLNIGNPSVPLHPPMFLQEVPILRHPSPAHSFGPSNFAPQVPMQLTDSELFHMPGGGTARVKETRTRPGPMIIPAQVLKQAAKSPFDSSGVSNSEWPDLPPRTSAPAEQPKPALASTTPTAVSKRKPKSRIAANFQNS